MPRIFICFIILMSVTGCGEAPFTKEMRVFRQTVQEQVAAAELERWATNCIATGTITESGVPAEIRQLMPEGKVFLSGEIGTSDRIVLFWTGGGFGHWGIAVGIPNYECTLGTVQTHWTNGIWFWHE